jgi:hypothetical protein
MYGFIRKCKCIVVFTCSRIFRIALSVFMYSIVFFSAEKDGAGKIVL